MLKQPPGVFLHYTVKHRITVFINLLILVILAFANISYNQNAAKRSMIDDIHRYYEDLSPDILEGREPISTETLLSVFYTSLMYFVGKQSGT